MEGSTTIALSSESDVRAALARQPRGALLLNFTAAWCQPCQAFAPVLAAVGQAGAGRFDVMKIDVDACPDLAREFGIRGVPATVLFVDGAERGRFVGAKSRSAFAAWLGARHVALAAPVAQAEEIPGGAFYGDPGLKHFLADRLYRHMAQGEVQARFMPWWQDGRGSVSAALVHHDAPAVFERLTNLPYALACVLEFLLLESRDQAQAVVDAIAPGADMRQAPLRFARAWLGHATLDWSGALDSAPHDALRLDWLDASAAVLDGGDVGAERWRALARAAQALASPDSNPYHLLEKDVATMIERLSPPPSELDADEWRAIFLGAANFSRARLLEHHAGWSKSDSAQGDLRERFFRQQVPVDADGRYDMALFEVKKAQWQREHADYLALENNLYAHYGDRLEALTAPLRATLVDILEQCRPGSPA